MMNSPKDTTSGTSSASQLWELTKQGLRDFFQQPLVKKSADILVPGVLAAALFPIFGPAMTASSAATAIQNSLKLIGISFSATTIDKLLNPLKGERIEEADILDFLQRVLPQDEQVNDEAAQALITILPAIKEAALANPKLDAQWLEESLENNLKWQGWTMAGGIAPILHKLFLLDEEQLMLARDYHWRDATRGIQVVIADDHGIIRGISQSMDDSDHGKIKD